MGRTTWYVLGVLALSACDGAVSEEAGPEEVANDVDAVPATATDRAAQAPRGELAAGATGMIGPDGGAVLPLRTTPPGISFAPGHGDGPIGGSLHDEHRVHPGRDSDPGGGPGGGHGGGGGDGGDGGGPSTGASFDPLLNASGSCSYNVINHGGRVVANPRVHRVFWGGWWSQAAHTAEATDYETTWTRLANDPSFYTRAGEYGVAAGSAGSRFNATTGSTGSVTEATIRSTLQSTLQAASYYPSASDIFVVLLPSGTTDSADFNASGVQVNAGHHDHFTWTVGSTSYDVVYAVIEYSSDRNYQNPVISHEVLEAATDPDLNAWYEATGGPEIGDMCRFAYNNIAGVQVETIYSQKSCRCVRERPLDQLDYGGSGRAMPTVFRSGTWYGLGAASYWNFGQAGDRPLGGDYDGDGRTEYALFRSGTWYILNTATGYYDTYYWGQAGDIPVPADYDGDGKTDKAVWRPSNGTWYVWYSAGGSSETQWGTSGDIPVPADFDNDGKDDIAVRRPSAATWYVLPSTTPGSYLWASWGVSSDIPVTGDFNADGKSDWALFRPSEGRFYIWPKDTSSAWWVGWGTSGDVPVTRDWDGDWKADVAVWRPSDGNWYVVKSTGGTSTTQWGTSGDIAVLRLPPQ